MNKGGSLEKADIFFISKSKGLFVLSRCTRTRSRSSTRTVHVPRFGSYSLFQLMLQSTLKSTAGSKPLLAQKDIALLAF
jgi:hypothetical protein